MVLNKKTGERLFLIFFGLAAFLLLLEIGMRVAGHIYNSYRIRNSSVRLDAGDTFRILCLGDSFTFGEGAPKGYSYPEQLQEILRSSLGTKFIVFNGGIPGSNSSQLARELEGNIQKYKPDIIIVMTGANNCSNFLYSNYFLFANESSRTRLYRLDLLLSHMRSYKLFKAVTANLYAKINSRAVLPRRYSCSKGYPRAPHAMQNGLKEQAVSWESMHKMEKHLELGKSYEKQAKINQAISELKKAIEIAPFDKRPYYMLGFVYLHRCPELKNNLSLAIAAFKKAEEIEPGDALLHINLFTAYHRSGELDSALEELKIINELNPEDEMSSRLLLYGIPDFLDMEIFQKMLKYDLGNIIALTASKNVRLIIQSYPACLLNGALRESAMKNKLLFVDNEIIFDNFKSLKDYKTQDYFAEDGHCNANGYRVIAQNIYGVLKSGMGLLE
jgi:lysophospholipase L1-like esterase